MIAPWDDGRPPFLGDGHAGGNEQIFCEAAIMKIYECSSGLPRKINRACTLSLCLAYQTNRLIVGNRMVSEMLEERVT